MISWKEDVIFLFWSIIKSALNKNSSMTDWWEQIGWSLQENWLSIVGENWLSSVDENWVRIVGENWMRIVRWELDENCRVKIGWELSGENWMRIAGENWMRIVGWELDENWRWELQGHFWKSHLLLHENCRWELSIIFAWGADRERIVFGIGPGIMIDPIEARIIGGIQSEIVSWWEITDPITLSAVIGSFLESGPEHQAWEIDRLRSIVTRRAQSEVAFTLGAISRRDGLWKWVTKESTVSFTIGAMS